MAVNRAFQIEIDVSRLSRLDGQLAPLSEAGFGEVAVDVVNRVADMAYDLAVPRMTQRINLTPEYVRDRFAIEKARNSADPRARVVALGGKAHTTTLARYGSLQTTRPVTWTNDRIRSMGKTFGAWPGWTERKGDQLRGIPANQKEGGISVEVTRGGRKNMGGVFFMPLRNGNGMGAFQRTGDGDKDYKHLYGPSVYQLFRYTLNRGLVDEVGAEFERQLGDEAERLLQKALK